MKRNTLRVFAIALLAFRAGAQSFEAASVKVSQPSTPFRMRGGPGSSDPGQFTYTNVSLKDVVAKAYGLEGYQLACPNWLADARYDIVAKVPASATRAEFQAMLQNLLSDRFQMTVHRETKELPIYAMVVAKNGPKLKVSGAEPEAATGDAPEVNTVSQGKDGLPVMPAGYQGHLIGMKLPSGTMLRAKGEPLPDFAKTLSALLDRPVFDLTGLTGKYDFGIKWTPVEANALAASDPGPDVFEAMQMQLGLRLDPRRAPVAMVVVDHVEKVPSEN